MCHCYGFASWPPRLSSRGRPFGGMFVTVGSFVVAATVLVLGLLYFRRVEQFFADVI